VRRWRYNLGLHDLGNGCYAWLQPGEATHSSRLTLIRRQRALRVMIANGVRALTPEQRIDWARLVVSYAGSASPDWGGGPRRLEALVGRGFGQGRRTGPAPP
jgi:hypothetical protein